MVWYVNIYGPDRLLIYVDYGNIKEMRHPSHWNAINFDFSLVKLDIFEMC